MTPEESNVIQRLFDRLRTLEADAQAIAREMYRLLEDDRQSKLPKMKYPKRSRGAKKKGAKK